MNDINPGVKKSSGGLLGAIGTALGAIGGAVAAPFTGGASLAIPAALGAAATGAVTGAGAGKLAGSLADKVVDPLKEGQQIQPLQTASALKRRAMLLGADQGGYV